MSRSRMALGISACSVGVLLAGLVVLNVPVILAAVLLAFTAVLIAPRTHDGGRW